MDNVPRLNTITRRKHPQFILKISILLAAMLSFVLSVSLYFTAEDVDGRLAGIYVGLWVPSIMSLGALLLSGLSKRS